jgi:hypothetical protein
MPGSGVRFWFAHPAIRRDDTKIRARNNCLMDLKQRPFMGSLLEYPVTRHPTPLIYQFDSSILIVIHYVGL